MWTYCCGTQAIWLTRTSLFTLSILIGRALKKRMNKDKEFSCMFIYHCWSWHCKRHQKDSGRSLSSLAAKCMLYWGLSYWNMHQLDLAHHYLSYAKMHQLKSMELLSSSNCRMGQHQKCVQDVLRMHVSISASSKIICGKIIELCSISMAKLALQFKTQTPHKTVIILAFWHHE